MFEEGNKLWQLRSKHGRDKIFHDANLFWEQSVEYFKSCDDNPWGEQDWVGKDAIDVIRYKKVPYTWTGLAAYLDVDTRTIHSAKEINSDFLHIYTRVENIIYTQKLIGAANGFFNANIIARDLGLADKKEVDGNITGMELVIKGERFADKA